MDLVEYDSLDDSAEQDMLSLVEVSSADEVKRIAAHSRVTSSPQFYLFSSPNRFEGNSSNPIQIAPLNGVQGTRMAQNSNANAPTTIAPKAPTTTARSATISNNGASTVKGKKRDERRRVTHNEVERRRRDKINHWIEKLGQLIPVDGEPIGCVPLERPNIAAADSTASKGGILSKACDYVTALHNKVNTLNECQKESKKIVAESQRLRDANAQLLIENQNLRDRLRQIGISKPQDGSS